ncbi:MAG: DNA-protecting protein DprA [Bacteroides sp.]|nr:DNA-protecting protein DprA [Bacteroides sp.]
MTELCTKIAFSMLRGINRANAQELLRRAGSMESIFTRTEAELAELLGRSGGIASRRYRDSVMEQAAGEELFVRNSQVSACCCTDDEYPRRLHMCDDAPALIYTLGHTPLDSMRTVAIVGTRHATPYGIETTKRIVRELAARYDNIAIISGLAYGIDVAAHRAALAEGIPTIGVMANALNTVYPADHRDTAVRMVRAGGMLISEYPTSSRIHRGFFLARNRIVAGLADAVVVVESDIKGGAMATARIASAYNRELFAVPGRVSDVQSRGCNELIATQAAVMLRDASDIGLALGWPERAAEGTQGELALELSDNQKLVVDYLREHPEAGINDMCVGLGMSYSSLSSLLFELEMSELLIPVPGGRYMIANA